MQSPRRLAFLCRACHGNGLVIFWSQRMSARGGLCLNKIGLTLHGRGRRRLSSLLRAMSCGGIYGQQMFLHFSVFLMESGYSRVVNENVRCPAKDRKEILLG